MDCNYTFPLNLAPNELYLVPNKSDNQKSVITIKILFDLGQKCRIFRNFEKRDQTRFLRRGFVMAPSTNLSKQTKQISHSLRSFFETMLTFVCDLVLMLLTPRMWIVTYMHPRCVYIYLHNLCINIYYIVEKIFNIIYFLLMQTKINVLRIFMCVYIYIIYVYTYIYIYCAMYIQCGQDICWSPLERSTHLQL